MDEEQKDLVKLAAEGSAEAFLRTVGAPLVETGGWGADVIRRYRFKSAVKTAELAKRWLEEAGLEAHEVPLKVLVPLLEFSSLEPDPDDANRPQGAQRMRERWAALLANAAAADDGAEVLPSFPRLLAELVPVEALMLEMLAEADWRSRRNVWAFAEPLGYDRWDPASGQAYMVHVDNLDRLNLCTISRPDLQLQELTKKLEDERRAQARTWPPPRRLARLSTDAEMAISALGGAFVAACTPPTGARDDSYKKAPDLSGALEAFGWSVNAPQSESMPSNSFRAAPAMLTSTSSVAPASRSRSSSRISPDLKTVGGCVTRSVVCFRLSSAL